MNNRVNSNIIIGANGYIGREFIKYLNSRHVANLPIYSDRESNGNGIMRYSNFLEYASNIYIDNLYFCAGSTNVANSNMHKEMDDNLNALISLCENIKIGKLNRFIYLSSGGAIYGSTEGKICDENMERRPISSYGLGKLLSEEVLKYYSRKKEFKLVILRPSNPFGLSQDSAKGQGLVSRIFEVVRTDQTLEIWGDGEHCRDYFHVDHLLRAMYLSSNLNEGFIVNISSGVGATTNEIVRSVENIVGRNIRREYIEAQSSGARYVILDNSYAIKLGLLPNNMNIYCDLEKAMREYGLL